MDKISLRNLDMNASKDFHLRSDSCQATLNSVRAWN